MNTKNTLTKEHIEVLKKLVNPDEPGVVDLEAQLQRIITSMTQAQTTCGQAQPTCVPTYHPSQEEE